MGITVVRCPFRRASPSTGRPARLCTTVASSDQKKTVTFEVEKDKKTKHTRTNSSLWTIETRHTLTCCCENEHVSLSHFIFLFFLLLWPFYAVSDASFYGRCKLHIVIYLSVAGCYYNMDQTRKKKCFQIDLSRFFYCAIIKKKTYKRKSVSPYYFKEFSCLKVFLKDLFCFFK